MEEKGLKKQYGLLTAISMVMGIVIGSGVFFKAQSILQITEGDMPLGILAWIVGGAVMICCVLAFSVLAQKYEKVNGIVDYAEATVGSKYSYLVGWFSSVIYTPAMTAALAWLTARYFLTFLCSVNPQIALAIPFNEGGALFGPECLCLAGFILVADYAVNALSSKLAGKLQVSTTMIKLIPIVLMAIVGTIYGVTHSLDSTPAAVSILASNFATGKGNFSPLFGAVVASAFAYEGWIIATSINSELKNSKRNLPIALVSGGVFIVVLYVLYYIGVAGGATVETLRNDGATVAFVNVFGPVFGNILNLFVAISCLGTLNGLLMGCTRGMYSISIRGYGPHSTVLKQLDPSTRMPANSAVIGLVAVYAWLLYFYGAVLAPTPWFGCFSFDSSELAIITIYALYIPILINFIRKEKDLPFVKRFLLPILGIAGSLFMVFAAIYSHGYVPYISAKQNGLGFSCPVLFYLIVFAVIMTIGYLLMNSKNKKTKKAVSKVIARPIK